MTRRSSFLVHFTLIFITQKAIPTSHHFLSSYRLFKQTNKHNNNKTGQALYLL